MESQETQKSWKAQGSEAQSKYQKLKAFFRTTSLFSGTKPSSKHTRDSLNKEDPVTPLENQVSAWPVSLLWVRSGILMPRCRKVRHSCAH